MNPITLSHPQSLFFDSDARIRAFFGGRGSGKTYILVLIMFIYALENPGSQMMIVGPTHGTLRNSIIKKFLEICPAELIANYNQSVSEIKMINDTLIMFRSANSDRDIDNTLRGPSVHFCAIDEIAVMSPYVWDVILPMIREGTDEQQKIVISSTPKMNWIYNKFKLNQPSNYYMIDEISSHSNNNLTDGTIQSLEDEFKGTPWYDAEILGRWVKQSGLIWDVKIIPHDDIPKGRTKITYSVDWGYQSPCAILTMLEDRGIYYIIDEYYQNHTIDEDVLTELRIKMDIFGKGQVMCDPAQLQSIDFLKRNKINAYPANNKRNEGIRTVRNMFDTGKLFVSDKCLNVIMEGNNWSWSKDDDDDKTEGEDHALDALRYLIMGIKPNSKPNFIIR